MEIFVYSDESGVFDCQHSRYFVFGGLVYLSRETLQDSFRRYQSVENAIREENGIPPEAELKACSLDFKKRRRLFRVTNREFRFGVVVEISKLRIRYQIAEQKKSRQRYMDFAFKIAIKRFFSHLIESGAIDPGKVECVHFFVDQHTTATDGKYELREGLDQELIHGTFNFETQNFYPPLFPKAKSVTLKYCDSKKTALIRASDIIANRIFRLAAEGALQYQKNSHFYVYYLPDNK